MANRKEATETLGWPDCGSDQVEVMLLGTYHMDNPGLDEVNVEADNVLDSSRQEQIEELVDRFVEWDPDRVAVERPYDKYERVNEIYQKYRSGQYEYSQEESFPAPHSMRDDENSECRSEVVQIGFRLADELGHEQVFPIDEHPEEPEVDPFEEREIDSRRKTSVTLPEPDAVQREVDERLASSSLLEYHRWMNSEDVLRNNHDMMFGRDIRAAGEEFDSPLFIAHWYDRNIRMVHHLWQALEEGDDRMFLAVGSGHIRILRHLLDETPMFCPVSPRPLLS